MAIPGKNGGQVAKEFAKENDIDVSKLDGRATSTRIRARKLRIPGGGCFHSDTLNSRTNKERLESNDSRWFSHSG